MDKDQQEYKKFLEEQLQWSIIRVQLLEDIDEKLHEMKAIAEYAMENELNQIEVKNLNGQLNLLKYEVAALEQQLNSAVH
ncbi:hypothetical protein LG291_22405 [Cytobacillus firmus]|uniref:hypothetical protein n=1 Tax=Cytobacillus firmus TaxID=1399 RepID=UPI0038512C6B